MPKRRLTNKEIDDEVLQSRQSHSHVRYIVMPITGHKNVMKFQAFDTKTDNFIGWQYTDDIQVQEKCNELNRLKAPH